MIKSVLTSLFAVFLFSLGAAGAWYFAQYQHQQQIAEHADGASPEADGHGEDADSHDGETVETASHGGGHAETADGHQAAAADSHGSAHATTETDDSALPIPVHGGSMSADDLIRLSFMYRKNMEQLKQKEADLKKEQSRLQLMSKDVEQRKKEIEGMLQQIQSGVEAAEQLLTRVQQERAALAAEKDAKASAETAKPADQAPPVDTPSEPPQPPVSDEARKANIQRLADIFSKLDEASSAEMIRTWVNKGEIDETLEILDQIPERDVAKILDAVNDPTIVVQITEAYRNFRRENTDKKRR